MSKPGNSQQSTLSLLQCYYGLQLAWLFNYKGTRDKATSVAGKILDKLEIGDPDLTEMFRKAVYRGFVRVSLPLPPVSLAERVHAVFSDVQTLRFGIWEILPVLAYAEGNEVRTGIRRAVSEGLKDRDQNQFNAALEAHTALLRYGIGVLP